MLASCVFLWGLQYKLSLYDPPHAVSHRVPIAKLLSKNELSAHTQESVYTQSQPTMKSLRMASGDTLFVLLIACTLCLPLPMIDDWAANPSPPLKRVHLKAYFVRPPPSHA